MIFCYSLVHELVCCCVFVIIVAGGDYGGGDGVVDHDDGYDNNDGDTGDKICFIQ
jgi:hypothetical protein